jgi:uncharacterized DUF497 family protein
MQIVFDEIKRQSNIRKHGLDFADIDASYFLRSIMCRRRMGGWLPSGNMSTQ